MQNNRYFKLFIIIENGIILWENTLLINQKNNVAHLITFLAIKNTSSTKLDVVTPTCGVAIFNALFTLSSKKYLHNINNILEIKLDKRAKVNINVEAEYTSKTWLISLSKIKHHRRTKGNKNSGAEYTSNTQLVCFAPLEER